MPEVRYYRVEQTRVVTVRANSETQAAAIATEAFANGETQGVLGNPIVTDLHISREN